MVWGSKKRPSPPPVRQEREFIEWLLRYGEEFELFRQIYSRNLEGYVRNLTDAVMKELRDHPSRDELSERKGAMAVFYLKTFMPLVEKRGGLHLMEPQSQAAAATLQVKMLMMAYILKYKYSDVVTIAEEGICGPLEDIYSR
jgi:hypothetical protein